MAVEVKVPQLGESIVEATVGRWLKQQGEQVSPGDALVELETDKVNMEVAAPDGGTLQSIARQEGETVAIGDVLAVIDQSQVAKESQVAITRDPEGTPKSQEVDQPVSSSVGQSHEIDTQDSKLKTQDSRLNSEQRVTPLARRVAAENGLDIGLVTGSGPGGRVTKEDVLAYLNRGPRGGTQETGAESRGDGATSPLDLPRREATAPAPLESGLEMEAVPREQREERVRMSRRRQTIARRLVDAQQTAAMLTTFNEADMSAIMALRKRRREAFKERYGVGLGFMSFFTRASVQALREFPRLNAEIQGDEIILKHYYDIGIAVGTDEGLVVPVVRDADRLSFAEIEREVADLAGRARDGRLTLPELQGGTFTITNGGIYGSLMSTPILNAPQVGILGMHKIQERPVAIDGQIAVRPMMYLALSYDHRIVDGSEAVRFLVRIKELIEDPELMLVEG